MIYCPKCGKKNEDDAKFCIKCGNLLTEAKKDVEKAEAEKPSLEEKIEDLSEQVEKIGKKVEEKTKDIDKRIEKASERFESWFDRIFGIFGPLVASFLGLIILRFIILVMALQADDVPLLDSLSEFFLNNMLLFFVLMLFCSYTTYFHRKFYSKFRWISPIFTATGIVILFWIASKIFSIVSDDLSVDWLADFSFFIENNLYLIFVVVLLVGYLILFFAIYLAKSSKK